MRGSLIDAAVADGSLRATALRPTSIDANVGAGKEIRRCAPHWRSMTS